MGEQWMKSQGIPAGMILFGGVTEFFGSLGLVIGLLTPVLAVLSALWMLSTTWFARSKLKKKYLGDTN
ncbi:hypothetical protein AUG19_08350 [archaeon 13_1_20CM_2_54_9]|nr:MAG: hypothetical protein AUG19_08350 [archaeon 13_1_20CM_2_54_9]